jgi:hypothetical protein
VNENENVEKEAEEANTVQAEEVAAKVMTEESAIEIKKNTEKVEEISTENADAQVDEAKPSNQLIIELDTKRDQVTSLPSPMVQLDGPMEEGKVKYTFLSDYAEEDIKYTLEEIFPKKNALLSSIVQCRPRSAECLCTVEVKIDSGQEFFWPEMDSIQVQVVQDLKEASS